MTENKRYKLDNGDLWDSVTGEMLMIDCDEAYYSIVDLLNELHDENQHIKQTIKEAYKTERTQIGQNVLKQLLEQLE